MGKCALCFHISTAYVCQVQLCKRSLEHYNGILAPSLINNNFIALIDTAIVLAGMFCKWVSVVVTVSGIDIEVR